MTTTANSTRRHLLFPWIVWIIGTLYFLFDYTNQVVPGAMKSELQHAFDANAMQFGFFAASYFYIYAAMQIPVGLLGDRFGPKRPLAIAACVAVAGGFLFTQADSVLTATLARMMIGIGASFSFVSVLKLIRHWFAPLVPTMCFLWRLSQLSLGGDGQSGHLPRSARSSCLGSSS